MRPKAGGRGGGDMRLLLLLGLDLPFARFHQRFIVQLVLCVCVCVGMGGKVKPFRRKAENERYVCDSRGRRGVGRCGAFEGEEDKL